MAGMAGLRASNLQVASVALKDRDTVAGTVAICFDLSWDFSWKDGMHQNWDAAWVFVKAYDEYNARWKQVALAPPQGRPVRGGGGYMALPHSIGKANVPFWAEFATSHTDYGEKTVGFFLYRKDEGNGSNLVEDIRLQWNYVEDGFLPGENLQVSVFAIEMVYIPQGPYYLGGKGTAAWQTGSFTTNGATFGTPMVITSENEIQVANTTAANTLWAANSAITAGVIPKEFPKGYQAFYIMKYEMTQQAYCEFLNTLSQGQQDGRIEGTLDKLTVNSWAFGADIKHFRNYIKLKQAAPVAIFGCDGNLNNKYDETDRVAYRPGDTLTRNIDGQDLAVTFVSLYDLLAYAEFAGLRPMTELEYEKACRGPKFVRKEMAWGYQYGICINSAGAKEPFFIDPFLPSERAVDPSACYLETGRAPWVMRVGGFAGDSTRRNQSGATYYGVMNMSDNLWERCVNVSTAAGRAFLPKEGDGLLDDAGELIPFDPKIFTKKRLRGLGITKHKLENDYKDDASLAYEVIREKAEWKTDCPATWHSTKVSHQIGRDTTTNRRPNGCKLQ